MGRTALATAPHPPPWPPTNAFSAIGVAGSIVIGGQAPPPLVTLLGAIALAASMTNIVSGFLITDRMLRLFKKPGDDKKR